MKAIVKLWMLIGLVSNVFAADCVLTVTKDNCWNNYDVNIHFFDGETGQNVAQLVVPANQNWGRVKFTCHAPQIFTATAKFSPDIWEGDSAKTYNSDRVWTLPEVAPAGDTVWAINMCYGKDFATLPQPLNAKNCKCDPKAAPAYDFKVTDVNA